MKIKAGILILVILCGAVACAQDPTGLFLPFYFIKGNVIHTAPINHNVFIYQTDPRVYGVNQNFTGASPLPYMVNIFDSQYFGKFDVPVGTYRIGVPTGSDGWGMDAVDLEITGMGFETKNLTLVLGGGAGLLPPEGTVPINIIKHPTTAGSIRLTWDGVAYPSVDIWKKTGDGSGQFTPGPSGWTKLADPVTTVGYYDDSGVFKTGAREVYYKGTVHGRDERVGVAWAVGKYDYVVHSGYNLIALPLIPLNGNSIEQTFYEQLTINDVELFARDDSATPPKYSKSQVISRAWSNISGSPITFSLSRAYWLRDPGTIGTLSLLGGVIVDKAERKMYANKYNLMGYPYVVPRDMATGGLLPRGDDEVFKRFEDALPVPNFQKIYNASGTWANTDPAKSVFGLTPSAGYWYRNTSGTDLDWTVRP